jgi:hypothetical protein
VIQSPSPISCVTPLSEDVAAEALAHALHRSMMPPTFCLGAALKAHAAAHARQTRFELLRLGPLG